MRDDMRRDELFIALRGFRADRTHGSPMCQSLLQIDGDRQLIRLDWNPGRLRGQQACELGLRVAAHAADGLIDGSALAVGAASEVELKLPRGVPAAADMSAHYSSPFLVLGR